MCNSQYDLGAFKLLFLFPLESLNWLDFSLSPYASWQLMGNALPRGMRTANDSAEARGALGLQPGAFGVSSLRLWLECRKGPVQR